MATTIFPLTTAVLQQQAREAAEQGIPLEEAHAHLAHDSKLREQFDGFYAAALQAEVA
jgi:hypothetical protein